MNTKSVHETSEEIPLQSGNMVKKYLQRGNGVILGIFGASLGLFGLFFLLMSLVSHHQSPAHILPADRTLALFLEPDEEEFKRLFPLFPILSTLPTFPQESTVAILDLGNKTQGWAILEKNGSSSANPGFLPHASVGSFAVTGSDPRVIETITASSPRLAADPAFRELLGQMGMRQANTFLVVPALRAQANTLLDALLLNATGNAPFIALRQDDRARSLLFVAEKQSRTSGVDREITFAPPLPSFALQARDIQSVGSAALALLSESLRPVVPALLTQEAKRLLGTETSLHYDLLPLLREQTTLQLRSNEWTDQTDVLLEGTLRDPSLAERISLLQRRATQSLPSVHISSRTFEKNFSMTMIGSAEERRSERTQIGQWTMERTLAGSGGFATAVRGNRFAMSTNPLFLQTMLEDGNRQQFSLPSAFRGRGTLLAGGVAELSFVRGMTEDLPSLALQSVLFPELSNPSGIVSWSIESNGMMRGITVQVE